ncbi:MAG: hypothetical protein AAF488_12015 [Planctomycetota bacterium]
MSEQNHAPGYDGRRDEELREEDSLPANLCPCLFTKTMSLNTEYRRSPFEDLFTADTAIFVCTRTMTNFGEDEDDACPERCVPGRSCYGGDVDPIDIT